MDLRTYFLYANPNIAKEKRFINMADVMHCCSTFSILCRQKKRIVFILKQSIMKRSIQLAFMLVLLPFSATLIAQSSLTEVWRTDGVLTVGMGERRPRLHQPVDIGRTDVRIVQRPNRIEALLVGADPEDVGLVGGSGGGVNRKER